MSAPEVELRSAWQHLVDLHHSPPLDHPPVDHPHVDHLLEGLLARHREPHRRYHTAAHVMWVLRHVDHIVAAGCHPPVDLAAVRLAALCHDAIYDPRRTDNEVLSADLAAHVASDLGWTPARIATVRRLVLATAVHTPTAPDEAVLVDADLAILGALPKDYAAYVVGVRAEYGHVPTEQWATGRAAVLRHFLDRPAVFHTEVMHSELEARARANMAAELATLR